jgi:hypothetical protein
MEKILERSTLRLSMARGGTRAASKWKGEASIWYGSVYMALFSKNYLGRQRFWG